MRLLYQRICLRVLGLLSILLPIVLTAGTAAFDGCTVVLASVSHYYYTTMSPLFTGVLYSTGLFLLFYKGDTRAEVVATRFAAICIVVVAILPTSKDMYGCSVHAYYPNALGEELHKAFAAFFLLTMSILFCLFARSKSISDKQTQSRNCLYYSCAGAICVIVFTIVALSKPGWAAPKTQQQILIWTTTYKPVFWLEWLALVAVGAAWLAKGQCRTADAVAGESDHQSPPIFEDADLTVC